MPRPLSEIATAIGGTWTGRDVLVRTVATDSRLATTGSLFFALVGERFDGHDFVDEALAAGAEAAVVHRSDSDGQVVRVPNTGRALLDLAADERRRMPDVTVIGVTGANGKTSTKDLTAAVLRARFATHASPASFNNEVGLPVTLLGAPPDVEVVVAEMGARRRGDVSLLSEVARPNVVVVTNVGVAHMELFGSWENIVESTAEPLEVLRDRDAAILCADDPVVLELAPRTRGRVVTFGSAPGSDVRAEDLELGRDGRAAFTLVSGRDREPVELAVAGEHMVPNALAAAACGLVLGLSAGECAAALKDAQVSAWRMETFTTPEGIRVVNDAYNANPESMAAALKAARWMAGEGRLIAVLGHMAELGPIAHDAHEKLGELVVRVGVQRLITAGVQAQAIARAAIREGSLPEEVASCADAEEALAEIERSARRGDVVLIKGSRVVGLERIAEALR